MILLSMISPFCICYQIKFMLMIVKSFLGCLMLVNSY